jgi:nicotinamidase-related amidase
MMWLVGPAALDKEKTFHTGVASKLSMAKSKTSHKSPLALILVDVINHFEFPDGDRVLRQALPIAPRIARLKKRARSEGIPVIYVNDNFGQWRSQASELVAYCLRPEAIGIKFVEQIQPDNEDYFVLKPMHSAFYQTPLDVLLQYLGATSLILCGLATNSCIVCTAHDANMREFGLIVPSDCSASRTPTEHKQTIQHIRGMTKAKIASSATLRLGELSRQFSKHRKTH